MYVPTWWDSLATRLSACSGFKPKLAAGISLRSSCTLAFLTLLTMVKGPVGTVYGVRSWKVIQDLQSCSGLLAVLDGDGSRRV